MSLSPLAAAAAFVVGVLLVLGIASLGKIRTRRPVRHEAPRRVPACAPPSLSGLRRFSLTSVDHAPEDLYAQVPCDGALVRRMAGRDRADYWLARLDRPVRWRDEAAERVVDHLVLAARYAGQTIDAPFDDLVVGIAFVVDPTLVDDATMTMAKTRYVAIGVIQARSAT